jgi:hypothetical protein
VYSENVTVLYSQWHSFAYTFGSSHVLILGSTVVCAKSGTPVHQRWEVSSTEILTCAKLY